MPSPAARCWASTKTVARSRWTASRWGRQNSMSERIDRRALVRRHNLELTASETVQVGNGEFAFSADITGLQSFEPYNIMSHWGWHRQPLPQGLHPEDYRWTDRPTAAGRTVPYPVGDDSAISN